MIFVGIDVAKKKVRSSAGKSEKIRVGLEATGHYSYNLLGFLLDNGLDSVVINPLHTNLYRKSLTLRKTKLTVSMHGRLQLCSCLMWTSSPTQTQRTTTKS